MNIQEAIEKIKNIETLNINDIIAGQSVDMVIKNQVIDIISQIDEPQKPVIPKFVADFYESIKDDFESKVYDLCLQFNRDNGELSNELEDWFCCAKSEPIQTLVKMKLYGYKVEKEKLYTVELTGSNSMYKHKFLGRNGNGVCIDASNHNNWKQRRGNHLTEAEIRQDFDFLWQFAKEVEVENDTEN